MISLNAKIFILIFSFYNLFTLSFVHGGESIYENDSEFNSNFEKIISIDAFKGMQSIKISNLDVIAVYQDSPEIESLTPEGLTTLKKEFGDDAEDAKIFSITLYDKNNNKLSSYPFDGLGVGFPSLSDLGTLRPDSCPMNKFYVVTLSIYTADLPQSDFLNVWHLGTSKYLA